MKLSIRNRFKGTVEGVEDGVVTSKVKIKGEGPILITAVVTKDAVKDLALKRGDMVEALVKSTSVMVAKEQIKEKDQASDAGKLP